LTGEGGGGRKRKFISAIISIYKEMKIWHKKLIISAHLHILS
jgi:hypothetical protein